MQNHFLTHYKSNSVDSKVTGYAPIPSSLARLDAVAAVGALLNHNMHAISSYVIPGM